MQDLAAAGGELPDAVVERLWNIIQALEPGTGQPGDDSSFKPHPKPRPGAALPGLALQNTREYAKQLDKILLDEATLHAKPQRAGAQQVAEELPPPPSSVRDRDRERGRDGSRERERQKGDKDRRDRDRDRDRDGERSRRDRSRSRSRDRRR